MEYYGIALKEKSLDEGLTRSEVTDLFDMLSGVNVIPMEVQGENSSAMGFINLFDADLLDYKYNTGTPVYEYIKGILDDMQLESDSCESEFDCNGNTIRIWLSR